MDLIDAINSKFDIFTHYPNIDKYIDGKIASIDSKYRGSNQIAKILTDKSFEYMEKNQIRIFHALCTSHFSARACENFGFMEIFQLRYADLLDANGNQLLTPAKPHVAARVFVKEVIFWNKVNQILYWLTFIFSCDKFFWLIFLLLRCRIFTQQMMWNIFIAQSIW